MAVKNVINRRTLRNSVYDCKSNRKLFLMVFDPQSSTAIAFSTVSINFSNPFTCTCICNILRIIKVVKMQDFFFVRSKPRLWVRIRTASPPQ